MASWMMDGNTALLAVVVAAILGAGVTWVVAQASANKQSQFLRSDLERANRDYLATSQSESALKAQKEAQDAQLLELRQRVQEYEQKTTRWHEAETGLNKELTRLESELSAAQTQLHEWRENLDKQWKTQFEALSLKTLNQVQETLEVKANRDFQERQDRMQKDIKSLLEPIQKMIQENETQVKESVKETVTLKAHLEQSFLQTKALIEAKDRIVSVLSDNKGRGDWGEYQLLRLLEMSGLVKDRDYFFQVVQSAETRPDVRVNLPNGNILYIDVKTLVGKLTQFEADLENLATDDERKSRTESLKREILKLSARDYQHRDAASVDFVILYVPRESMLRIPLEVYPTLMEEAFERGIILSSPLILMGLLKTVAQGWAHAKVADHAKAVMELAKDLHKRAGTFVSKFEEIEKALDILNKKTDGARTSLTGRMGVLPQIQKLESYGAKSTNALPEKYRLAMEQEASYVEDSQAPVLEAALPDLPDLIEAPVS